jgi:hypothetical protein
LEIGSISYVSFYFHTRQVLEANDTGAWRTVTAGPSIAAGLTSDLLL